MIVSYRDKRTRTFAEGGLVQAFTGFRTHAAKRLAILEAATMLSDLQGLPSNRLEALRVVPHFEIGSGFGWHG